MLKYLTITIILIVILTISWHYLTSGSRIAHLLISKMELLLSEYFTLGNIFLAIVSFLILNQLIELYQFRNMPPGPRLTSLPFIGNLLSFDAGDSLHEATARFVNLYISLICNASILASSCLSFRLLLMIANFVLG